MSAELHLPDLPEVPVAIGAQATAGERRLREAWDVRLRGLLGTYLPLLMMSALAVGTWWLAKQSPRAVTERVTVAPRHDPDYTARRVVLERFNAQGQRVVQVEGEQARHYPDTDEIEIDRVNLSATGVDGRQTQATARQAVAAGDSSRYSLEGGARVLSTGADGHTVEIEGEHLVVMAKERRVRADRPVVVRQGGSELRADGLDFDETTQRLQLHGHVRGRLLPQELKATGR